MTVWNPAAAARSHRDKLIGETEAAHCLYCFGPVAEAKRGRKPKFCSAACKQAHYRLRKNDYQRRRVSASLRALTLRNVTGTGTE